jgi:hypothetical protein
MITIPARDSAGFDSDFKPGSTSSLRGIVEVDVGFVSEFCFLPQQYL